MRWVSVTAIVAAVLGAAIAAGEAAPTTGEGAKLHVATLNIAHGRGTSPKQLGWPPEWYRKNISAAAESIRRHSPDVIALQEADDPSAWSGLFDHVEHIAETAHYPHVHHGLHFAAGIGPARVAYGTALLSRIELLGRESHEFERAGFQFHTKGFVLARTALDGRDLVLVSAHFHSESAKLRRREAWQLIARLNKLDEPVVLMGDLNSRWSNENDAVRILARELNLQAFKPDTPGLETFRDPRPNKRIDWILISPALQFVDYRTWPDRISDHRGVSAWIRWRHAVDDERANAP